MLKVLQRRKKTAKKDRFLKKLFEVYSSPWSKRRGTFRDVEKNAGLRDEGKIRGRFESDVKLITAQLLAATQEDRKAIDVLKLLHFEALHPSDEALFDKINNISKPDTPDNRAVEKIILDQILDPDLMVFHYDYDFIDEIVHNVRSRYVGAEGRYLPECSERFLKALWFLCGGNPEALDIQALPGNLQSLLGPRHPYKPPRYTREEYLKGLLPADLADEFIALRCEDNPKRYVEISAELFREVNARATDQYSERDISLIYGYENNHHLILRTLINLIGEGKITAEDEVLVIGPRYADEIHFFRNILGLPKTIGLDLRDEGDYLKKGDMHEIPFPDNHFKLVFGANVLEYAYDLRKVVRELARVTKRPGYLSFILRSNRTEEPTPIGRMTAGNVEVATNVFYEYPHKVLAKDPGLTESPEKIGDFPSYVIELS